MSKIKAKGHWWNERNVTMAFNIQNKGLIRNTFFYKNMRTLLVILMSVLFVSCSGQSKDKNKAIKEIIEIKDFDEFLRVSEYSEKFK